jgi:hypothetical protein
MLTVTPGIWRDTRLRLAAHRQQMAGGPQAKTSENCSQSINQSVHPENGSPSINQSVHPNIAGTSENGSPAQSRRSGGTGARLARVMRCIDLHGYGHGHGHGHGRTVDVLYREAEHRELFSPIAVPVQHPQLRVSELHEIVRAAPRALPPSRNRTRAGGVGGRAGTGGSAQVKHVLRAAWCPERRRARERRAEGLSVLVRLVRDQIASVAPRHPGSAPQRRGFLPS